MANQRFASSFHSSNGKSTTRIVTFKLADPTDIENIYLKDIAITHSVNGDNFNIMVKGLFDNKSIITDLFSIQGSLLSHFDVTPVNNEFQQSFNISNFAAGSYLIRVGNANFQKVIKVSISQ